MALSTSFTELHILIEFTLFILELPSYNNIGILSHLKLKRVFPNAKHIILRLPADYLKIERAILTLDNDFNIEKPHNIIKGEAPNNYLLRFVMMK